jgi:S-(hydroxymethyl)glutathione dehydrogenase / alcohol dehydrogenase
MPFAQAALLGCGVVTGAGCVLNTANVRPGDSVVISGAGGVGLNAVSGARIAGASRIVVIDIQQRLDAARRFGATDVIDSTASKPVEAVRSLLAGGADHVFDFVGLKLVAEEGPAMLGVGGGLYLVGVSRPEVDINLNIFGAIGSQKRVVGVNFGSTNAKRDIPMYAHLYLQGRMNLDDLHAAVLGADLQRARRVASQIRSGRVVINGMTDDPQAPWGGFKYSGVGREYGRYGIEAFLENRAILES